MIQYIPNHQYNIVMPSAQMSIDQALDLFYQHHGFAPILPEQEPCTVHVYNGCLLVPLPNIGVRHRYLKYHDLHHILTGYSVGRIGESEVSAWELGTGSMFNHPILGVMNLIALSTGFFLQPKRMWSAFQRGVWSRNLYAPSTRIWIDVHGDTQLTDLRSQYLADSSMKKTHFIRTVEFCIYLLLAFLIHAVVVIPALIVRIVSYLVAGESLIKAIQPKRRSDLY
ncbi:hypothetical protein [Acinetobacter sp. GXMZU3951]